MVKIKERGLTLVEIILVMTIVAILTFIMVRVLNPASLMNRGRDAQRKKDLARIKVAFEEYNNDKGCYPNDAKIAELTDVNNCKSNTVFSPWLGIWPCDPNGNPYIIKTDDSNCPKSFRIITNLEFKEDRDIPNNWYESGDGVDEYTINEVNYGVSSTNVLWYRATDCTSTCNIQSADGGCSGISVCDGTKGQRCYMHPDCKPGCRVDSCVQ